jgi:hypothetical protein
MKQKDNLSEAKIRESVKKYLDTQFDSGEISKFCAVLSEKLVMITIESETYQKSFKSNGVMQIKTKSQIS